MKPWSLASALAIVGLVAVCCWATWATAQEPPTPKVVAPTLPPPPGGGGPPPLGGFQPGGGLDPRPSLSRLRTKVFRLTLCDAHEVQSLLEQLLEHSPDLNVMPGFNPAIGGGFGGGGLTANVQGIQVPGLPGGQGAVPFGGGGLGGGLGGLGQGPAWRVAVEPRTRALLVRGSERELQIAQDLITTVETPDDKPLPAVKSLRAFRLKYANAEELASVFEDLGLEARVVAAPLAKLIIATGPEEALRDLGDVVKELDVEVKKPDKPAAPKRLVGIDSQ